MADNVQPNWLVIARREFAGFQIRGYGPFAVVDPNSGVVNLYAYRLEAAAHGHVIELKPTPPRTFRKPSWAKNIEE